MAFVIGVVAQQEVDGMARATSVSWQMLADVAVERVGYRA